MSRRVPSVLLIAALVASVASVGCRNKDKGTDNPQLCDLEDSVLTNSSFTTAHAINAEVELLDAQWTFDGHLCTGDEDWFTFDAFAGQTVMLDLSFAQSKGDLQLELLSSEGSTLELSESNTDMEAVRRTLTADETLYVRIFGDSTLTENDYSLSLNIAGTACALDAMEPNDSSLAPALADSGSYTDLTVCYGEDDWYQLPVADGQVASVELVFDPTSAELDAALYQLDASNNLIWLADSAPSETGAQFVSRVSGVGPFLVHVTRGANTVNATYQMNVQISGEVCEADAWEPNDGYYDPWMLAGDTLVEGGTLCLGDQDWFQIDLDNGEVIQAELLFLQAQNDLGMRLYQLLDDGTLSYRVGASTWSDDELINYRPSAAGTYLVNVFAEHGTAIGTYDLDVKVLGEACVNDSHEPNDSYLQATDLVTGNYADMTLCVGDDDWYTFEAQNGQLITGEISFDHTANDLGIALYKLSADGALVWRAGSDTYTDDESFAYRPFEDGTFVMRVYRSRGTQLATYTMDFAVTGDACDPDQHEPNDGYPGASDVANGSYSGQTLCVGDSDWYAIEAHNGQLIDVAIDFSHAQNDLGLSLYKLGSDGTVSYRSGSDTLTDGEEVLYRSYEEGTFLYNVYRSRGTQLARYTMDVNVSGEVCSGDAFEPNNAATEATAIAEGSYLDQTLCVGDADWYLFEARNGQIINANIDFSHAVSDLGMQLYRLNDDGTWTYRTGSDTLSDDETIRYQPYDDGTFLLYVYRSRGTTLAHYGLSLDITGDVCEPDAQEPNNAVFEAVAVSEPFHGEQTLCVGDADWYSFEASNGQLIDASISFNHSQNDLGMALYKLNEDGSWTARSSSDTLTNNEQVLYRPYDDGTFLLYVYRTRGTNVASYTMDLSVDGDVCEDDSFEPNNAVFEAAPLSTGTHLGETLCVGDADWYTFEARNGQLINAQIDFSHAANDLGMALYKLNDDGTWSSRSGSDTLTDGEEILYQPYDDGTFLLYVYRTRGTSVAEYDVSLAINGAVCDADSHEPNNAGFEAAPITSPFSDAQTLCVGDTDWFEVEALNGQLITVDVNFDEATQDLGVQLYKLNDDGTWTSRAGSDVIAGDEHIIYRPYDSGTFLVYVYRSRGTTVASYDIDVNVTGAGCVPDAYEPNNANTQGADMNGLFTDAPATFSDLTLCVGDDDYYTFHGENGQLVNARIDFSHAENDLGFYLYRINSDGTITGMVGSDTLTDNEWLIYRLYQDAEYLLRVYRTRGTTLATYDMTVSLSDETCIEDAFEPNDHWLQATDFTPNVNAVTPTTMSSCVGDIDYLSLGNVAQGKVIRASAYYTYVMGESDIDLQLYVLNTDGTLTNVASATTASDDDYLVYTVPSTYANREFILRTNRGSGAAITNYDLEVNIP
ncbi:MAG: hypothetical protein JXX28_19675 [Deltaproteobacteria bacterium]|nr:hypothetical protein [Deltaproteobacteria bacterium]